MTEPKFKSYPIWFGTGTYRDPDAASKERVNGRCMIRGMLMFNDLDLVDDPWDKKDK